jgi:hypothetical protein
MLRFREGLLSRPCARMETKLLEILIAVMLTGCVLLVIAMLAFGPRILEWIEGTPREPELRT